MAVLTGLAVEFLQNRQRLRKAVGHASNPLVYRSDSVYRKTDVQGDPSLVAHCHCRPKACKKPFRQKTVRYEVDVPDARQRQHRFKYGREIRHKRKLPAVEPDADHL